MIRECSICKKRKECPFCLTSTNEDGTLLISPTCSDCVNSQISIPKEMSDGDLVDLILGIAGEVESCSCGMTDVIFEMKGRFGCDQCYSHFPSKMESLVFPFHGAKKHMGKRPKCLVSSLLSTPEEQRKILKLRLARAVELEDYELAGTIKKSLESLPLVSLDQ